MTRIVPTILALCGQLALMASPTAAAERWTAARAHAWYDKQPWLVGSNYNPASAINELEMWQSETFDPTGIDRELGWAEAIGMNTMRVYLHNLLWEQDAPFQETHRCIPHHRGQSQDPSNVRAVRQLLGSGAKAWTAASADSGRS